MYKIEVIGARQRAVAFVQQVIVKCTLYSQPLTSCKHVAHNIVNYRGYHFVALMCRAIVLLTKLQHRINVACTHCAHQRKKTQRACQNNKLFTMLGSFPFALNAIAIYTSGFPAFCYLVQLNWAGIYLS